MADKKKNYEFSCDECSGRVVAYPPDGTYTNFSVKRCCEKSIERFIRCSGCDHKNKRFWCVPHMNVGSVSSDHYQGL